LVRSLSAVIVSAEVVDLGIVVSRGKGLFVADGPTQLLSSANKTAKYKSDRVGLPFAMGFFMKAASCKQVYVFSVFESLAKRLRPTMS
jgi:hypothetical protein